jgi:hypothetical protein
MALFTFLGAPLGTLMMVVARKVSGYRAENDYGSSDISVGRYSSVPTFFRGERVEETRNLRRIRGGRFQVADLSGSFRTWSG